MYGYCRHIWKEITQTFMQVIAGSEYGGDGKYYHYCCVKCLRIASTEEVMNDEKGSGE